MRPNNAMFEEFLNFNNFFSDPKSARTSTDRKKNCSTLGWGNFGFLDSPKVILTENQIKTPYIPEVRVTPKIFMWPLDYMSSLSIELLKELS